MKKLLITLNMFCLLLPSGIQSITPAQAAVTAFARNAYEKHEDIDPAIIQMIHDVVEQIAVEHNIADYAAKQDWDKVLELARNPKVNLNDVDEIGNNVLAHCISHDRLDLFKFLAGIKDAHGKPAIDLKAKVVFDQTLLMFAVEGGKLEFVKYLVRQKDYDHAWTFDLNDHASSDDRTILMRAVLRGRLDMVRYLSRIKNKAGKFVIDLNAKANWGGTALIDAVSQGHLEIVKYLTQIKDADGKPVVNINVQDNYGYTALDYAKRRETEIYDYLYSLPGIYKGNWICQIIDALF